MKVDMVLLPLLLLSTQLIPGFVNSWMYHHRHQSLLGYSHQQHHTSHTLIRRPSFQNNFHPQALQLQSNSEDVYIITGSNGYIGRAIVHELLLTHTSKTDDVTIGVNNDSATSNDDSNDIANHKSSKIICLVRSQRVDTEQSYWDQQNNDKETFSITVLPYDMLDGGSTFQLALDFVLQQSNHSTNTTGKAISSLCVFHVASVFGPTDRYQQTAMENVKGTIDLIDTYGSTIQRQKQFNSITIPSQCKFILTSSMAAVRGTGQLPLNQRYYTHQDWNTYSDIHNETTKTNANWGTYYQWSKMESERQAWDLCNHQWSDCIAMTALCPSFVFGPLMDASSSLSSSYSITLVDQWVRGISPVQSRLFVDVRDVAKAHVMAAINDAAIGQRIILSTEARISSQEIAHWIREEIQQCKLPIDVIDPEKVHFDAAFQGGSIPIGDKEVDSTDALQRILGITLRPVKDTIVDMTKILLSASISK